jgi:hypothetical protein
MFEGSTGLQPTRLRLKGLERLELPCIPLSTLNPELENSVRRLRLQLSAAIEHFERAMVRLNFEPGTLNRRAQRPLEL